MSKRSIIETKDGRRNICGAKLKEFRLTMSPKMSRRKLAEQLQCKGLDIDVVVIKKIEEGVRLVTDIELKAISDALEIPISILLS